MPENSSIWWRLTHLEPAVYRGVVVASFALPASFGVVVSPAIPDATITFVVAAAALVQAVWTRNGVTANARVAVLVPDPVNAPDVVASGAASTSAPTDAVLDAARSVG